MGIFLLKRTNGTNSTCLYLPQIHAANKLFALLRRARPTQNAPEQRPCLCWRVARVHELRAASRIVVPSPVSPLLQTVTGCHSSPLWRAYYSTAAKICQRARRGPPAWGVVQKGCGILWRPLRRVRPDILSPRALSNKRKTLRPLCSRR